MRDRARYGNATGREEWGIGEIRDGVLVRVGQVASTKRRRRKP